jgi:hypothetical protein
MKAREVQLQVISSQEQLTKAFGQPQRATGERGSSDPPATGAARCAPDTLRVPDSAAIAPIPLAPLAAG